MPSKKYNSLEDQQRRSLKRNLGIKGKRISATKNEKKKIKEAAKNGVWVPPSDQAFREYLSVGKDKVIPKRYFGMQTVNGAVHNKERAAVVRKTKPSRNEGLYEKVSFSK